MRMNSRGIALGVLLRGELRSRWQRMLVVALLLGAAGGLATGVAIGAQRTSTAYTRFLDRQIAFEVAAVETLDNCAFSELLDPTAAMDCDLDHLIALEQLATIGRFTAFDVEVLTADGRSVSDSFPVRPGLTIVRPEEGFGTEINRSKILDGRMPSRSDEVLISVEVADRLGLEVGDVLQFRFVVRDPADPDPVFGSSFPGEPQNMRVTGIGVAPGEIAPPSGSFNAVIQLARNFESELDLVSRRGVLATLAPGVSTDELLAEMTERQLFADLAGANQAESIQREIRPQAAALALIALLGGLASFAVLGQLLARHLRNAARSHRTLSDIGFARRDLIVVGASRVLGIAIPAALIAGGVALCFSPLMPIGVARVAEPDPGIQFTAVGIVVGVLATGLLVILAGAAPVLRQASHLRETPRIRPPHNLVRRFAPSPVGTTGMRFAFERGSGGNAAPIGSSVIASAFGVMALVAALVFTSGLDHLLGTPRLSGWNWDVTLSYPTVEGEGDAGDADSAVVAELLASDPDVESFAFGTMTQRIFPNYPLRLGDGQIFLDMISIAGQDVSPTVIDGRAPTASDEILVGPATAEDLDAEIGDTVKVWGRTFTEDQRDVVLDMTLVGIGVIPIVDESTSRVGEGAALIYDGLRRLREEPLDSPGYYDTVFLNLRDGVSGETVEGNLLAALGLPPSDQTELTTWDQPKALLTLGSLREAPLGVAAMMALLALASVVHLLLSTIRLRRNDIAVLKCIGMRPAQVRHAVAWQVSVTALVVLAIGVPVGIIVGRSAWLAFATDFGVEPEATTPVAQLALIALVALVVVNLVAAWPARRAANLAPATALKAG